MVQTSAKISVDDWHEFFKDYSYKFIADPDYRLGQAFCNTYEHKINDVMDKTLLLFFETSNEKAWDIIKQYIDGDVDGPFSKRQMYNV